MRIELVKQIFDGHRGYKYKPFLYCCNKLRNSTVIKLSDECPSESDMCNKDGHIPQMMIHESEIICSYGDEWQQDYYYPIKFCPFCGEPVKVDVVSTEDKTEYYNRLNQERGNIWKRCQVTDSKSEEQVLLKRRNELDNLMEDLYELGEYIEEQPD